MASKIKKPHHNLLLTSEGLTSPAIKQAFTQSLRCPIEQARVAFIPTAANVESGDKTWIKNVKKSIKSLGVKELKTIDISQTTATDLQSKLYDTDAIFVNGGNTFYLLYHIRKSRLDKLISKLLKQDVLYVGVSAGSIVAGQTINTATWKGYDDPTVVDLDDLTGLGLVPFDIFCHYEPQWKNLVRENRGKLKHKLITLTNNQAVLAHEKNWKII